ncbi:MAG: hypothetical protein M3004_00950 [Bacteroidota bacterium]|nr:hypothetical protein [Bacteroidota bacterium]
MNDELRIILEKQLNTIFPENTSFENMHQKLSMFINDLIQNDFPKLINVLYKVDVDEKRLKKILKENADEDSSSLIARLIIERELQKIKTRKRFQ